MASPNDEANPILRLKSDSSAIVIGQEDENPVCVLRTRQATSDEQGSTDRGWVFESNCPIVTPVPATPTRRALEQEMQEMLAAENRELKERLAVMEKQVAMLIDATVSEKLGQQQS